ncbi:hypothetical protein Tco_0411442 [Tanacetum coccineum]
MATFKVLETRFQKFIKSQILLDDEDDIMTHKVNERHMQTTEEKDDTSKALAVSLVETKSSGTESGEDDTSSRSRNDAHVNDADIRLIYDEEPMAEIPMFADDNVSAIGQQYTKQPEFNNE